MSTQEQKTSPKKQQDKKQRKLEKELVKIQEEAKKCLTGWQRAQADYQNLKKETEAQKKEWIKYAHDQLIVELLPVYDNFKMSLVHVPKDSTNSQWVVGLTHIKNQLQKVLEDNGVKEIDTMNQIFDPEFHEAVEAVETDTHKPDTIIEEVKPGYTLHGKVIQVARVKVAEGVEKMTNNKAQMPNEAQNHND